MRAGKYNSSFTIDTPIYCKAPVISSFAIIDGDRWEKKL